MTCETHIIFRLKSEEWNRIERKCVKSELKRRFSVGRGRGSKDETQHMDGVGSLTILEGPTSMHLLDLCGVYFS